MADFQRICSVDGCGKAVLARGWCRKHYARWRSHGDPTYIKQPIELGACKLDGCDAVSVNSRGWCQGHYDMWRRHGDPLARVRVRRGKMLEWLKGHVDYDSECCLPWPFLVGPDGYGRVSFRGSKRTSSRVMCILAHGEPPTEKHEAAHSCGRGHEGCVNPRHLRWATPQENQIERVDHGTSNRGERQHLTKLTAPLVREIRAKRKDHDYRELAQEYGVSQATIHNVWAGRSWSWLK